MTCIHAQELSRDGHKKTLIFGERRSQHAGAVQAADVSNQLHLRAQRAAPTVFPSRPQVQWAKGREKLVLFLSV